MTAREYYDRKVVIAKKASIISHVSCGLALAILFIGQFFCEREDCAWLFFVISGVILAIFSALVDYFILNYIAPNGEVKYEPTYGWNFYEVDNTYETWLKKNNKVDTKENFHQYYLELKQL